VTLTQEAQDARSFFASRPDNTVTAWVEQNVYLPANVTQNAGTRAGHHRASKLTIREIPIGPVKSFLEITAVAMHFLG
jgi:hypothetical protein